MMRTVGTVSRGIRAPIIKQGDDLVEIVAQSVVNSSKEDNYTLNDLDVVGVTEAILARSQGNYATLDQIAADVRSKFPGGEVGLIFPILSRNRFSMLLKGIARGVNKIYIQLSYPSDEVGNPLVSMELIYKNGINPTSDVFTENEFKKVFGDIVHPFTGVDYIQFYKELTDGKAEIILANDPRAILQYTKNVITADIHTRKHTKRVLKESGANKVFGTDELLTQSVNGSGYHPEYGLLGSNLATDDSIKLFPRDAQAFAEKLSARLFALSGKKIEAMVYGDGAFKDPVGGIWELADPVVSPGFTSGLQGTPNELKLKYLADNMLGGVESSQAGEEIKKMIKRKEDNLINNMSSQGTTPRRITDLLGSLCDLTSGSGDKGTPIVLVQGYFDNYAD